MPINYYQILNIQNDAKPEVIREAYKKQSLIWHSDTARKWALSNRLSDCETVFKMINTAYETLSNQSTRENYNNKVHFQSLLSHEDVEEIEFAKMWSELKKAYEIYKSRESDPNAFIAYLQQEISEQKLQVESQLQKLTDLEMQLKKLPEIIRSSQMKMQIELKAVQSESLEAKQVLAQLEIKNNEILAENALLKTQLFVFQQEKMERFPCNAQADTKTLILAPIAATNISHENTSADVLLPSFNRIEKMTPKGLEHVYKIVGEDISKERVFSTVKLLFKSKEDQSNFISNLAIYYENRKAIDPEFVSSFTSLNEMSNDPKKVLLLRLQFMNCNAYFESNKNFRLAGSLMLAELEKIVDIKDVQQSFVDFYLKPIADASLRVGYAL